MKFINYSYYKDIFWKRKDTFLWIVCLRVLFVQTSVLWSTSMRVGVIGMCPSSIYCWRLCLTIFFTLSLHAVSFHDESIEYRLQAGSGGQVLHKKVLVYFYPNNFFLKLRAAVWMIFTSHLSLKRCRVGYMNTDNKHNILIVAITLNQRRLTISVYSIDPRRYERLTSHMHHPPSTHTHAHSLRVLLGSSQSVAGSRSFTGQLLYF